MSKGKELARKCPKCRSEWIVTDELLANIALQQENQKLRELFEAYCVCNSMGATGGQCCFCEDLEKITKGTGKTI